MSGISNNGPQNGLSLSQNGAQPSLDHRREEACAQSVLHSCPLPNSHSKASNLCFINSCVQMMIRDSYLRDSILNLETPASAYLVDPEMRDKFTLLKSLATLFTEMTSETKASLKAAHLDFVTCLSKFLSVDLGDIEDSVTPFRKIVGILDEFTRSSSVPTLSITIESSKVIKTEDGEEICALKSSKVQEEFFLTRHDLSQERTSSSEDSKIFLSVSSSEGSKDVLFVPTDIANINELSLKNACRQFLSRNGEISQAEEDLLSTGKISGSLHKAASITEEYSRKLDQGSIEDHDYFYYRPAQSFGTDRSQDESPEIFKTCGDSHYQLVSASCHKGNHFYTYYFERDSSKYTFVDDIDLGMHRSPTKPTVDASGGKFVFKGDRERLTFCRYQKITLAQKTLIQSSFSNQAKMQGANAQSTQLVQMQVASAIKKSAGISPHKQLKKSCPKLCSLIQNARFLAEKTPYFADLKKSIATLKASVAKYRDLSQKEALLHFLEDNVTKDIIIPPLFQALLPTFEYSKLAENTSILLCKYLESIKNPAIKLSPEQIETILFISREQSSLLTGKLVQDGTGTGKTMTSLHYLASLLKSNANSENKDSRYLMCFKNSQELEAKIAEFRDVLGQWGFNNIKKTGKGTIFQKIKITVTNQASSEPFTLDVHFMTARECLKHKEETYATIIIDEAHRFLGKKSKHISELIPKTGNLVSFTASPISASREEYQKYIMPKACFSKQFTPSFMELAVRHGHLIGRSLPLCSAVPIKHSQTSIRTPSLINYAKDAYVEIQKACAIIDRRSLEAKHERSDYTATIKRFLESVTARPSKNSWVDLRAFLNPKRKGAKDKNIETFTAWIERDGSGFTYEDFTLIIGNNWHLNICAALDFLSCFCELENISKKIAGAEDSDSKRFLVYIYPKKADSACLKTILRQLQHARVSSRNLEEFSEQMELMLERFPKGTNQVQQISKELLTEMNVPGVEVLDSSKSSQKKFQNGEIKVGIISGTESTGLNFHVTKEGIDAHLFFATAPKSVIEAKQACGRHNRRGKGGKASVELPSSTTRAEACGARKWKDVIFEFNSCNGFGKETKSTKDLDNYFDQVFSCSLAANDDASAEQKANYKLYRTLLRDVIIHERKTVQTGLYDILKDHPSYCYKSYNERGFLTLLGILSKDAIVHIFEQLASSFPNRINDLTYSQEAKTRLMCSFFADDTTCFLSFGYQVLIKSSALPDLDSLATSEPITNSIYLWRVIKTISSNAKIKTGFYQKNLDHWIIDLAAVKNEDKEKIAEFLTSGGASDLINRLQNARSLTDSSDIFEPFLCLKRASTLTTGRMTGRMTGRTTGIKKTGKRRAGSLKFGTPTPLDPKAKRKRTPTPTVCAASSKKSSLPIYGGPERVVGPKTPSPILKDTLQTNACKQKKTTTTTLCPQSIRADKTTIQETLRYYSAFSFNNAAVDGIVKRLTVIEKNKTDQKVYKHYLEPRKSRPNPGIFEDFKALGVFFSDEERMILKKRNTDSLSLLKTKLKEVTSKPTLIINCPTIACGASKDVEKIVDDVIAEFEKNSFPGVQVCLAIGRNHCEFNNFGQSKNSGYFFKQHNEIKLRLENKLASLCKEGKTYPLSVKFFTARWDKKPASGEEATQAFKAHAAKQKAAVGFIRNILAEVTKENLHDKSALAILDADYTKLPTKALVDTSNRLTSDNPSNPVTIYSYKLDFTKVSNSKKKLLLETQSLLSQIADRGISSSKNGSPFPLTMLLNSNQKKTIKHVQEKLKSRSMRSKDMLPLFNIVITSIKHIPRLVPRAILNITSKINTSVALDQNDCDEAKSFLMNLLKKEEAVTPYYGYPHEPLATIDGATFREIESNDRFICGKCSIPNIFGSQDVEGKNLLKLLPKDSMTLSPCQVLSDGARFNGSFLETFERKARLVSESPDGIQTREVFREFCRAGAMTLLSQSALNEDHFQKNITSLFLGTTTYVRKMCPLFNPLNLIKECIVYNESFENRSILSFLLSTKNVIAQNLNTLKRLCLGEDVSDCEIDKVISSTRMSLYEISSKEKRDLLKSYIEKHSNQAQNKDIISTIFNRASTIVDMFLHPVFSKDEFYSKNEAISDYSKKDYRAIVGQIQNQYFNDREQFRSNDELKRHFHNKNPRSIYDRVISSDERPALMQAKDVTRSRHQRILRAKSPNDTHYNVQRPKTSVADFFGGAASFDEVNKELQYHLTINPFANVLSILQETSPNITKITSSLEKITDPLQRKKAIEKVLAKLGYGIIATLLENSTIHSNVIDILLSNQHHECNQKTLHVIKALISYNNVIEHKNELLILKGCLNYTRQIATWARSQNNLEDALALLIALEKNLGKEMLSKSHYETLFPLIQDAAFVENLSRYALKNNPAVIETCYFSFMKACSNAINDFHPFNNLTLEQKQILASKVKIGTFLDVSESKITLNDYKTFSEAIIKSNKDIAPLALVPGDIKEQFQQWLKLNAEKIVVISTDFINTQESSFLTLPDLSNLTSLRKLILKGCTQIIDLSFLSNLTKLQALGLNGCTQISDLSPLKGLTKLQALGLNGCTQISDLSPLKGLTKLQKLGLNGCTQIRDFSPLKGLTKLQALGLNGCTQISDLLPLKGLTKLQGIDLSGCTQISDLSPLKGLTKLQALGLNGCTQISDLSPLKGLTKLQKLGLNGCTQIRDFSPLKGLTKLQALGLNGCDKLQPKHQNILQSAKEIKSFLQDLNLQPKVKSTSLEATKPSYNDYNLVAEAIINSNDDITPLSLAPGDIKEQFQQWLKLHAEKIVVINTVFLNTQKSSLLTLPDLSNLTSLRKLILKDCTQIIDLSFLSNLTKLQALGLNGCTQISDLSPLAGLTGLQTLDLSNCTEIHDLSPIKGLTKLQWLYLSSCTQIRDLSPLSGLTKLRGLHLSGCTQIHDLSPLKGLTKLQWLYLSSCTQIRDLSPLSGLTKLRGLRLSGCTQIHDLSPLKGLTKLQKLGLSGCTHIDDIHQKLWTGKEAVQAFLKTIPLNAIPVSLTTTVASKEDYDITIKAICQQNKEIPTPQLSTGDNKAQFENWLGEHALRIKKIDFKSLDKTKLQVIPDLSKAVNLKWLYLYGCTEIRDLSPLKGLTGLQELNLYGCKEIRDLSPLKGLTGLQELNLIDCNEIRDLLPLSGLTGLRGLGLNGCKEIRDLLPLKGLTGLQELNLFACNKLPKKYQTNLYDKVSVQKFLKSLKQTAVASTREPSKEDYDITIKAICQQNKEIPTPQLSTGDNKAQFENWLGEHASKIDGFDFKSLDKTKLQVIPDLSKAVNLKWLNLYGCTEIRDFSPLSGLTKLRGLRLSRCTQIHDLSPLKGLTGLQELDLIGCAEIRDLSPLKGLTKLQELNLFGCDKLPKKYQSRLSDKVSVQKFLKSLKQTAVASTREPSKEDYDITIKAICQQYQEIPPPQLSTGDNKAQFENWLGEHASKIDGFDFKSLDKTKLQVIPDLSKAVNLKWLNLPGCTEIRDLSPLSGLTGLQALGLSRCTQICDLSPLSGLTGLRRLNLFACTEIHDLSPIKGLTKLQWLYLSSCTQIRDLSPLSGLTKLRGLHLSGCTQIHDLSPLKGLTKLQWLYLSSCTQIRDLSPLSGLTGLRGLDLFTCTEIRDLSPLKGLTGLQELNLSGCNKLLKKYQTNLFDKVSVQKFLKSYKEAVQEFLGKPTESKKRKSVFSDALSIAKISRRGPQTQVSKSNSNPQTYPNTIKPKAPFTNTPAGFLNFPLLGQSKRKAGIASSKQPAAKHIRREKRLTSQDASSSPPADLKIPSSSPKVLQYATNAFPFQQNAHISTYTPPYIFKANPTNKYSQSFSKNSIFDTQNAAQIVLPVATNSLQPAKSPLLSDKAFSLLESIEFNSDVEDFEL